jgi:ParB family transcriptional regulator, chromosome partitioning protein
MVIFNGYDVYIGFVLFYSEVSALKVKISDIIIKDRIREDMGDLSKLKDSLRVYGLINPITLTEDFELLAGYRRLQSARELGWEEVECRIMNPNSKLDKLRLEVEENFARKDFTPEEIIHFRELERYLTAAGFEKVMLWIIRAVRRLQGWLAGLFRRHKD